MPGPTKIYPHRLKVSMTEEMREELRLLARYRGEPEADTVREAIGRLLRSHRAKIRAEKRKQEGFRSLEESEEDIQLAWGAYLRARELWWKLVKGARAPQAPKLTYKRKKLIWESLESNGKQPTVLAGKGVWLSDFHTERGYTGPEYAWRATNIEAFSKLVVEERIEA